jgi:hypothetical protein
MTWVLAEYTFARLAEMEEKNLEQLTEAPTRST